MRGRASREAHQNTKLNHIEIYMQKAKPTVTYIRTLQILKRNPWISDIEEMQGMMSLDLETSGVSSTSGLLELSTLGHNLRSLVLVRTEAEVSDSLSSVSWASDKDGVLTLRGSQSQLVQGDSLTTSLENLGLGAASESQSSDGGLWNLQQSDVVGDGTNNNNSLLGSTLLSDNGGDLGKRHRWSVDLGQEQRLQHNLVEWGVGTA